MLLILSARQSGLLKVNRFGQRLKSRLPVCSSNAFPVRCGAGSEYLRRVLSRGSRGSLEPGPEPQARLFLAGISWKDKVADLRLKMAERNVVWFVVTALDEIACECSGFTVRACYPVSPLVPRNLCVHANQLSE